MQLPLDAESLDHKACKARQAESTSVNEEVR